MNIENKVVEQLMIDLIKMGQQVDKFIRSWNIIGDELIKGRDQLKEKLEDENFQKHFETIGIRLKKYFG